MPQKKADGLILDFSLIILLFTVHSFYDPADWLC